MRKIHYVRSCKPKGKPAQYVLSVSLPKQISEALGLQGGEYAFFSTEGPDKLSIQIIRSDEQRQAIYNHYAQLCRKQAEDKRKEYKRAWYQKKKAMMAPTRS